MNTRIVIACLCSFAAISASLGQDTLTVRRARDFERRVMASRPDPGPPSSESAQPGGFIDAGPGPIPVHVPASYDGSAPAPLVIPLHGYLDNGPRAAAWRRSGRSADPARQ